MLFVFTMSAVVLHTVTAVTIALGGHKNISDVIPSVPFWKLNELLNQPLGDSLDFLEDAGGRLGFFTITDMSPEYISAISRFRSEAVDCIGRNPDLPEVEMMDGSRRRTYATSSGLAAHDDTFPSCLTSYDSLSRSFDEVDRLVAGVVRRRLSGTSNNDEDLSYYTADGRKVSLEQMPHLDHVHVYHGNKMKDDDHITDDDVHPMVPVHVDNGIYLLITPFPQHPLHVGLSDGKSISSGEVNASNSVLVLMGRGLTDWLLQNSSHSGRTVSGEDSSFYPVPHWVPNFAGTDEILTRSVFARMKVALPGAIPVTQSRHSSGLKTFREVFEQTSSTQHSGHDSSFCLGSDDSLWKMRDVSMKVEDPWTRAQSKLCDNGEAYCWMGCRPLPKDCPDADDAICYSKKHNVTCSTQPGGKPMDTTCKWECKKVEKGEQLEKKFCTGSMDMLMSGFEVAGKDPLNPCVILFFSAWTLDSQWKFNLACLGVTILGFLIEALIASRRSLNRVSLQSSTSWWWWLWRGRRWRVRDDDRQISTKCRKVVCLVLFGVNLVLGYLAMLVAMTYSVELFLCVVLGLVVGHGVFNMRAPVGETTDPCCAPSQNPSSSVLLPSCPGRFNRGDNLPAVHPCTISGCSQFVFQDIDRNGVSPGGGSSPSCISDEKKSNNIASGCSSSSKHDENSTFSMIK